MSLIPRSIRRYRREHPYNHPVLFFFIDAVDSLFQIVLVCGVIFMGYNMLNNAKHKDQLSVTEAETDLPINNNAEITLLPAGQQVINASSVTPATSIDTTVHKSDAKRLLDNTDATQWVNSLPESHYTIQFAASIDKSALIAFADEYLTKGAVIYPFKHTRENVPMYGVASGLYDSLYAAMQAIDKLPASLQEQGPWVRPAEELQQQVSAMNATH